MSTMIRVVSGNNCQGTLKLLVEIRMGNSIYIVSKPPQTLISYREKNGSRAVEKPGRYHMNGGSKLTSQRKSQIDTVYLTI